MRCLLCSDGMSGLLRFLRLWQFAPEFRRKAMK